MLLVGWETKLAGATRLRSFQTGQASRWLAQPGYESHYPSLSLSPIHPPNLVPPGKGTRQNVPFGSGIERRRLCRPKPSLNCTTCPHATRHHILSKARRRRPPDAMLFFVNPDAGDCQHSPLTELAETGVSRLAELRSGLRARNREGRAQAVSLPTSVTCPKLTCQSDPMPATDVFKITWWGPHERQIA